MPALHLGTHPQIIYYHNIDNQMVLDIFDVQRQAVVAIIGENEHIQTAQISDDGQWVLMVASNNAISEMQLVRVDGKFFQTLYCAPAGQQVDPSNSSGTQWSPDQKQIIFTQGANANAPLPLYLLNVASGHVQKELTPGPNSGLNPTTDFLMLNVNGNAGTGKSAPTDGFWKINTDGSGLKQLNSLSGGFNRFTQYPWSNFSRYGLLYTDGLFYGSLTGGPLTRYASDGEGDGNMLVGWTTI